MLLLGDRSYYTIVFISIKRVVFYMEILKVQKNADCFW